MTTIHLQVKQTIVIDLQKQYVLAQNTRPD